MPPTATTPCPRCQGPGNPSNFGATCDTCVAVMNPTHVIDLRSDAGADRQEVTR